MKVICDQCRKRIGDRELAYFSNPEKQLDFCSAKCHSGWKEWIEVLGEKWKKGDFNKFKEWKNQDFSPKETQQWLNKGLNKGNANFAKFLLDKGYTLDTFPNDSQLNELKEEYFASANDWSIIHEDFAKENSYYKKKKIK